MNNLIVLNAGLSNPSTTRMVAERIANAVDAQVTRLGEAVEIEYIDIRDYATDLATMMTTGIPSQKIRDVQDRITAADGLVAATPVFASSYSGLFKMFIDSLDPDSINGMPVLIAATAETPRHSLVLDFAMRPLFVYLRANVMTTGVFAATEDFGSDEELDRRIERAANQLAVNLVRVSDSVAGLGPSFSDATPKRDSGTHVSDDFLDFTQMLKGHDGN